MCGEPLFTGDITHNSLWENRKDIECKTGTFKIEKNINSDPLFVSPQDGIFRPKLKRFGYNADSPLLNAGFPAGSSIGLFVSLRVEQ
jgi:hypothetical protein